MAKDFLPLLVLFAGVVNPAAWSPEASSAASKLDLIRSGRAAPGSTVVFTAREINAYAAVQLPVYIPRGWRNARLELGNGSATGTALVDFVQVRRGAGQTTNWFLAKLIEGERPVKVTTSIQSAHGRATVYLRRVEISGVAVSGSALDFLIDNFLRPIFPEVRINEPFPLLDNIERIEVRPNVARALIRPLPKPAAPAPPVRAARHSR
ncbi:MAG: hypothetical protein ABSH47_12725 [Bryobacteraceae bacterium]